MLRAYAWLVLAWERLWPLAVPLLTLAIAVLIFSWIGGWQYLGSDFSSPLYWLSRLALVGALGASLWPLRLFRAPEPELITRQIEAKSGLENQPLTAQSDDLAMGETDAFARALWQEHKTRMANQLTDLTAGTPAATGGRFDPYMMRAILPIVAFAALLFSYSPTGGSVGDILGPNRAASIEPVRMDAWITPPAYTRKPPVFLSDGGDRVAGVDDPFVKSITAPVGSEFVMRFIGSGALKVTQDDAGGIAAILPKESDSVSQREFSVPLNADTIIRVEHRGKELAQWGILLTPDQAPIISFVEEPSAALSGSLQLTYSVEDDYGIESGDVLINSMQPVDPDARPLVEQPDLALNVPRSRGKKAVGKMNKDLTDHPWAGSDVSIALKVTDAAGQTATTLTKEMVLPGRRFSDPLALSLVEQRRILAFDANQQRYVSDLLDAVSTAAPEYIEDASAVLGMRAAYRRLVDARDDDELRSVLDLLWEIALAIEYGNLSDAEQALRDAQERLSEALENDASDEEIDRLMQELREAMNEMLQALAEQMRQNPQAQNPFEQNDAQMLTQNDLERMMNQIEDLAKSGSKDAAQQMLSELQRMMDNLQAGRHQQQNQAEGNEFNKALDKMSELMQRQQELMNETFRMQRNQQQGLRPNREQGQRQQGQQQQQQGQQQQGQQRQQQGQQEGQQQGSQQGEQAEQGQGGQMTEEEFAEALRQLREQQQALEQQLGELSQQMEQLGLGQSPELGEAQGEMGQAGENLGQGQPGDAAGNQANALEALRQGAQNMMQQMAGDRQQGGQQLGQQQGQQQGQAGQQRGSDPLGRETGNDGLNADSDVEVPGEIDTQRARRILDAIRDRLAIPDNPLIEKDYLERLLRSE